MNQKWFHLDGGMSTNYCKKQRQFQLAKASTSRLSRLVYVVVFTNMFLGCWLLGFNQIKYLWSFLDLIVGSGGDGALQIEGNPKSPQFENKLAWKSSLRN